MRKGWLVLGLILVLLFSSANAWAEWYRILIHSHSTYSDGDRTPKMLKMFAIGHNCSGMIVTDHFEQIPKEKKLTGLVTDDFGFEKYLADFQSSPILIVISDAEISVPREKATSHVLAIGDLRKIINREFGSPKELLEFAHKEGLLLVAAHPNQKSATSNFIFDTTLTPLITGIEMFNESKAEQKKTLDWYLRELAAGRPLFVTSGCDSHTSAELTDLERWTRITYVWIDGPLTAASLFEALQAGRTYAACGGVQLTDLNYLPGFQSQEVSRPQFSFSIHFPHRTLVAKQIRIYRVGTSQPVGLIRLKSGQADYSCSWEDKTVEPGQHRYILELENFLITSPIVLSVKESPTSSTKPIQTTRMPLLFSKSPAEVIAILGQPDKIIDSRPGPQSGLGELKYQYQHQPAGFKTEVEFDMYRRFEAVLGVEAIFTGDPKQAPKAADFAPTILFETKPSSIGLNRRKNQFGMNWEYLEKRHFGLILTHPSRQVWTAARSGQFQIYKLNVDWKECRVLKYVESRAFYLGIWPDSITQ